MIKNIVLIGLMGSGKSMVAKALEARLGLPQFSTDVLIEAKEGRSIQEIFQDPGEAYFRQIEHAIVFELARKKGVIIDCGGGVILDAGQLPLLKKNGVVFHLKTSPEVIYSRIKGDPTRPLVNVPDPRERIAQLFKERMSLYDQADVILDASDPSVEGVVARIIERMSHERA